MKFILKISDNKKVHFLLRNIQIQAHKFQKHLDPMFRLILHQPKTLGLHISPFPQQFLKFLRLENVLAPEIADKEAHPVEPILENLEGQIKFFGHGIIDQVKWRER